MEFLTQYVLRLTCGAMICALLQAACGTTGHSTRIRQIISALFLLFIAITPLKELNLRDFSFNDIPYIEQGSHYAEQGSEQAQTVLAELISEQYVSYILSRAAELSLSPEVFILLDETTQMPVEVTLSCEATPSEKSKLTDVIHLNLGIERSSIHWKP